LGRLSLRGIITSSQCVAGFRLAEIYHKYERCRHLTRAARSGSWESAYGDSSIAEELLSDDALAREEARVRRAVQEFQKLQTWFSKHCRNTRLKNAIEMLCVDDVPINVLLIPVVAVALDAFRDFTEHGPRRIRIVRASPEPRQRRVTREQTEKW